MQESRFLIYLCLATSALCLDDLRSSVIGTDDGYERVPYSTEFFTTTYSTWTSDIHVVTQIPKTVVKTEVHEQECSDMLVINGPVASSTPSPPTSHVATPTTTSEPIASSLQLSTSRTSTTSTTPTPSTPSTPTSSSTSNSSTLWTTLTSSIASTPSATLTFSTPVTSSTPSFPSIPSTSSTSSTSSATSTSLTSTCSTSLTTPTASSITSTLSTSSTTSSPSTSTKTFSSAPSVPSLVEISKSTSLTSRPESTIASTSDSSSVKSVPLSAVMTPTTVKSVSKPRASSAVPTTVVHLTTVEITESCHRCQPSSSPSHVDTTSSKSHKTSSSLPILSSSSTMCKPSIGSSSLPTSVSSPTPASQMLSSTVPSLRSTSSGCRECGSDTTSVMTVTSSRTKYSTRIKTEGASSNLPPAEFVRVTGSPSRHSSRVHLSSSPRNISHRSSKVASPSGSVPGNTFRPTTTPGIPSIYPISNSTVGVPDTPANSGNVLVLNAYVKLASVLTGLVGVLL